MPLNQTDVSFAPFQVVSSGYCAFTFFHAEACGDPFVIDAPVVSHCTPLEKVLPQCEPSIVSCLDTPVEVCWTSLVLHEQIGVMDELPDKAMHSF